MAFGSKRKLAARTDAEEASVVELDCSNSGDEQNTADGADEEEESAENGTATAAKPLLDEVILLDARKKNTGGSRPWRCKHCDKKYTSSYTRIREHFFGVGPGKTPQISRCSVANDRVNYKKIYDKVLPLPQYPAY
jgi:isocitrate lyase